MPAQYDNTNSGALFNNERKQSLNHPDFTGSINVNGVDFWISGRKKVGKNSNKPFISLSVTEKEPKTENEAEDFNF